MEKKDLLRKLVREEIKSIKEISPELFKRATDISRSRGQDQRTVKMGQTFFNQFVGKPLMGGVIKDVTYAKPQQGYYEEVGVTIDQPSKTDPSNIEKRYMYYDVEKDEWDINDEITRADARILSLIAQKINPKTQYQSGGQGFRIKGYGMDESINENKENYMFFQNLKTIRDVVDEMLSLDPKMVDMILSDGHDWANDHVATSKDDLEEVHNFLISKKAPVEEKELSPKQKKIAKAAPPEDKITGADFAALRKSDK